ncbi:MAG: STAS domain-containing protein [Bacilli bacterium]
MLNIDLELKNKILFARLFGVFNNENIDYIKENLFNIVSINNINKVIINMSNLRDVDEYALKFFIENKDIISFNNKLIICQPKQRKIRRMLKFIENNIYFIENEDKAIELFERMETYA